MAFKDFIHFINIGKMNLSDKNHVENHLKYLYSLSASHKINSKTSNNYAVVCEYNKEKKLIGMTKEYVKNPSNSLNSARKSIGYLIEDVSSLVMDRSYPAFLINTADGIVGNIFKVNHTIDGKVHLEWGFDDQIVEYLADDLKYRSVEEMSETFLGVINASKIKYIHFDDVNKNIQTDIENELHKRLFNEIRNYGGNSLISMSHHDQIDDSFHIHRLWSEIKKAS